MHEIKKGTTVRFKRVGHLRGHARHVCERSLREDRTHTVSKVGANGMAYFRGYGDVPFPSDILACESNN
jgi:hypothetical protein